MTFFPHTDQIDGIIALHMFSVLLAARSTGEDKPCRHHCTHPRTAWILLHFPLVWILVQTTYCHWWTAKWHKISTWQLTKGRGSVLSSQAKYINSPVNATLSI